VRGGARIGQGGRSHAFWDQTSALSVRNLGKQDITGTTRVIHVGKGNSQVPTEEVEEWSINEQSSSIGYACARSRLEWHMHRLSTSTVTVTVRNRNGHVRVMP
jgi:hypothetical protein